ncbi:centrosomal protein of 78 kDa [Lingula anatina]|uniref:Centrosomal protein of 78 kDa n=1 Tax=Lingula anatina TaxID=7574 RepID=A0A1S3JDP7_LINAN|nr:centrosomal protein of 78 kDa [Lingula anatina]|eukprot:XP_013408527.1 centrosomal protein of 78 kDa [Lingula anatina]
MQSANMIESVKVRQRGAYDFEAHYNYLCALQDSVPLPAVKAHLSDGVLDVSGDRVRANDWVPLLNTLRINKTLEFIAFRSYYRQVADKTDPRSQVLKRKTPAIRSKEITYRLCRSLRECLTVTPSLTCLELQGLPLRERDLTVLAKGILKNRTLNHLSLEYCPIGDAGLEILCKAIKNSGNIASVNFTGCGITSKGADMLAKIVRHQAMKRHNEAWQDSLRYRRPDLDKMAGLRRITMNCNPLVGDAGASAFAEALKDDLWLKALDIQQCGVGSSGGKALLDTLKFNTTIVVLDIRANPMIDRNTLQSIMEHIMINSNGQDTEYKWIKAESPKDPMKITFGRVPTRKRRTVTLNGSIGKKTSIKISRDAGRKRSKTSPGISRAMQQVQPKPGLPWRTALRASRYKGFPPEHTPGRASVQENMENTTPPLTPAVSLHMESNNNETTTTTTDYDDDTVYQNATAERDVVQSEVNLGAIKEMKIELEQLRRQLAEEKQARSKAENKMLELTVENGRLHQEISTLRAQLERSPLDDDKVLESIESSFKQFHSFLDMLREAGLGQLITVAGLDQSAMPFGKPTAPGYQMEAQEPPVSTSYPRQYHSQGDLPVPRRRSQSSAPRMGTASASHAHVGSARVPALHTAVAPPFQQSEWQEESGDYESPQQPLLLPTQAKPDADYAEDRHHTIQPRVRPDNYQATIDPTMQHGGDYEMSQPPVRLPPPQSDELYQRLLQDTRTVLPHAASRGDAPPAQPAVILIKGVESSDIKGRNEEHHHEDGMQPPAIRIDPGETQHKQKQGHGGKKFKERGHSGESDSGASNGSGHSDSKHSSRHSHHSKSSSSHRSTPIDDHYGHSGSSGGSTVQGHPKREPPVGGGVDKRLQDRTNSRDASPVPSSPEASPMKSPPFSSPDVSPVKHVEASDLSSISEEHSKYSEKFERSEVSEVEEDIKEDIRMSPPPQPPESDEEF